MSALAAALAPRGFAARIAPSILLPMNAPIVPERLAALQPERLLRPQPDPQLPLATAGVQRWVWEGRYGTMLIEVVGDAVFVNGDRVEAHAAPPLPRGEG